jgi:hypothetical protein
VGRAVTAVAVGAVVFGDKAEPEKTEMLNTGTIVDLAELEGDDDTDGDCLYEIKVPSPLTLARSEGKGSKKKGGAPASVGHKYAFGNTREQYEVKIWGCRRRGRPRDGPFRHSTGGGWVRPVRGAYHDAIFAKRSRVVAAIVESLGGITPSLAKQLHKLELRAKGRMARDDTKYGVSRTSARSYYVHHVQDISCAAVIGDARAIKKELRAAKQKYLCGDGAASGAA